ncbi:hypothetical protein [Clostridium guangxiense]|uniref:hypothetical protein n=1 Tax=Clostridium guangxiense TaxID=1662055 RepID=UPI001E2F14A5|nr:hypothetical protein [Clostridium guangxiense]MCD2348243.1 hypothetical protein [Clostridium guangxiense]
MYKVETHNNSREYFSNLKIENDALYITANDSLEHMIIERTHLSEEKQWRVIDIENFINDIYPSWTNTINRIKLKAQLRMSLTEIKNRWANKKTLREIKFLEENLSLLLSDLIFLVEAGVRKLDYKPQGLKLQLIKEIFNDFINREYFKEVSVEVLNIKSFSNIGRKISNSFIAARSKYNKNKGGILSRKINQDGCNIKRVYFYNLNFLDLKRYMIAQMLKLSGYEVIFRIPYFNNLKVVNKSWNMIYNNKSIFNIAINNKYSTSVKENLRYLDFLEKNNLSEFENEKVTVINYSQVCDFQKHVNNNIIVTFCKDSLQSCMKRNNLNIRNHCYQSTLGRFIFNLYNCEVENNIVKLNFNTFREMITSGWVQYKDWNGIRLSSFLMDNEEYFSGVSTIDEIIDRIDKIKDIEEVSDIFEGQVKNRIKNDKTKGFLSNPFRAFSYANLEKYNITANYMLELSLRLKRFILKEFETENELIDVKSHLENMVILFRNKYIVNLYNSGDELQKRIVRKIYWVINNPDIFGKKFYREELSELFNSYLVLSKYQKQEQDFSIDQLEGVVLRDNLFYPNKKKLCVSDLSYKAYQEYTEKYKEMGKILSMDELKIIFKENLKGWHREVVLQGIYLQEQSRESFESYIKFALANLFINFNKEIEFSWIEGLRTNDSKSILLKQIEALYGSVGYAKQSLDYNDVVNEDEIEYLEKYSYDKKLIKSEGRKLPEVAYRDLDFCEEKFLFSSILEEYPIYYSDFHHKLVFSALISMLKNSIENAYSNIYNYIFKLFPQWEDVVKKNILDCEYSRKNLKEYRYFDGINYPKNIYALYLLKSKYIVTEKSKIRNKYNKGEFDGKKYYDKFVDEYLDGNVFNSGFHCMMCPHCYICGRGDFVIEHR